MPTRTITVLSCGALALGVAFVAGCGSDDNKNGSAPSATATTGAAANGSVIEVSMKNNLFSPEKVTGKVGQTVKWTNDDGYAHNVVATKGEKFQSDNFADGTYEYKLDKPGKIDYVCTIHSGMVGSITVTK